MLSFIPYFADRDSQIFQLPASDPSNFSFNFIEIVFTIFRVFLRGKVICQNSSRKPIIIMLNPTLNDYKHECKTVSTELKRNESCLLLFLVLPKFRPFNFLTRNQLSSPLLAVTHTKK